MKKRRSSLVLPCAFGVVFFVGATILYHQVYAERILPQIFVGSVNVGGLTREAARTRLAEAFAHTTSKSTLLVHHPLPERAFSLQTKELFTLQANVVDQAFALGRTENPLLRIAPYALLVKPYTIDPERAFTIQTEKIRQALEKAGLSVPAQEASFAFTTQNGKLVASVTPSHAGIELALETSRETITEALTKGATSTTLVATRTIEPTIQAETLTPFLPDVTRWVASPLTLVIGQDTLVLSPRMIADLIALEGQMNSPELGLSQARIETFFKGHPLLAESAPKNGRLTLNASSTVAELVIPTQGQAIDLEKTRALMQEALANTSSTRRVSVPRTTSYGVFEGAEAERLGIRELIGRGDSHFSGSPANRRKNIALGAQRVHATLVPPNEEFSMMKTLGPITGEMGWLPELVIKGDKTIPEFGGGLCQIGTTAFRGVVNTGLPVTERRNHSYRVRYYEPAGTDATLYDPAPDFKFKNDTPTWIIITKDLRKDDVSFLFWGTKDGRVVSSTKPFVTNIIAAPPKKIIETTELAVGETKCTEKEHAGATASFDYHVTYPNGETKNVTFRSVYRPWQAVCLVGVAAVAPNPLPTPPTVDETGLNSPG